MNAVVLDQQRTVAVTNLGTVPQITVQSPGLQGPQGLPTTVNGHTGSSVTLTAADVGAVPTTAEGAANGVATLDASTLIPIAQIPVNALSADFVDLSTAQTVNGVKTFGSIPVGPNSDPTSANQLARKSYIDNLHALSLPLAGGTMTGNITLVGDPTAALHPATKQYVDALIQGLSPKPSVVAATTGALPANTYANGASGVGATLTGTANGALAAQDGVTLTVNQLLLVKNEAAAANNGIYTLTQVGDASHPYILTRHIDMDQTGEIAGAFTFVESGTTNSASGWVVAGVPPFTVGTTAINWTQFSGAGEITAGTGLTKTGNTIALSTPVPVNLGGTGSATQNFVDLTTAQTVAGAKTLSNALTVNAATNLNGQVTVASGTATPSVQSTTTQTGGQIFRGIGPDVATVLIEGELSGDAVHRVATFLDGHTEIGPGGSTARDTVYGRAAAGILYTSKTLLVGASASIGSGGVGVIEVADAATPPGSTPTGGGAFYSSSGKPFWKDSAGNAISLGGRVVCTSTTHPGAPFTGLEIYETDTGLFAIYNGSAWVYPPQLWQSQTVSGSTTGTLTFNNIPQVGKTLKVVMRVKTAAAATFDTIFFTINNITTANYNFFLQSITNAGAPANQNATGQTSGTCGLAWGNGTATNGAGLNEIEFPEYSVAGFAKGCRFTGWASDGNTNGETWEGGSMLKSTITTAAITRLDFITGTGNFTSGSTIDVYIM